MKSQQPAPNSSAVRITVVNTSEQTRRVDEAIARRAYEIFERRGGLGWHELEDWRRAESEIRSRLCIGLTTSQDSVLVSFYIGRFEKDSVEIWVAPRQITICGKMVRHEKESQATHPYRGLVFRVVTVPIEIEPGRVFTRTKQNFLEIHLPMAHTEQTERISARAA